MNPYELFTLGQHLSCWPEEMTYKQVIEAIYEQTSDISPWCVYEDMYWDCSEEFVETIEDFKKHLTLKFIPRG